MINTIFVSMLSVFGMALLAGLHILASFLSKRMALNPFFSWQRNKPHYDMYYARRAVDLSLIPPYLKPKYALLFPLGLILFTAGLALVREGSLLEGAILSMPSLFVYVAFYFIFEKLSKRHYQDLKDILEKS